MDQSLLTRCPHCQTLFHTKQEDLDMAGGEVRCGLCFQVFNAAPLQTNDNSNPPANQSAQPTERSEQEQHFCEVEPAPFDPEHDQNQRPFTATTDEDIIPLLDRELIPSNEELDALEIEIESIDSMLAEKDNPPDNQFSLWLALSLAAALLLALQWAWFNKSELSQQPGLRPWYTLICNQLNCTIPPYRAISDIRTEGLSIRAAPGQNKQLIVDLVIINKADFAQQLPGLTLQFFDLNQNILAQRTFQPAEYFKSSVPLQYMPVNVAVHISFSIIDPGANAVNFSVQLTSPDNPG